MNRTYDIVVIDDDREDIEIIAGDLEQNGHRVNACLNLDEFFFTLDFEKPDAILVDMVSYDMPGWQVCERIKTFFEHDVKIIAISGVLTQRDIDSMNIKADGYLVKPFTAADVERVIEDLFSRSPTRRDS